MVTSASPTHSLEIRRTIRASRERVYDASTIPEALTQWFAPSADFTTVVHEAEPRAWGGGRYRIEMRHRNGSSHIAVGTYRELSRPSRLSFSWRWEGTPMAETIVTVELTPAPGGTELVLKHTGFTAAPDRNEHVKGWTGCLERIETVATAEA